MIDLRYTPERRIVAYIPHPEMQETCVVNASTGKLPAFTEASGLTREQLLGQRIRHITGTMPSVDHATGSDMGTLYVVDAPRIAILRKGYAWLNHSLPNTIAEQQSFMSDPNITAREEDVRRALEANLDKIAVGALAASIGHEDEPTNVRSYMFYEQADLLKKDPPEESFHSPSYAMVE